MIRVLQLSAVMSVMLSQCVSFESVTLEDQPAKKEQLGRTPSAMEEEGGDLLAGASWVGYGQSKIARPKNTLVIENTGTVKEASGATRTFEGVNFGGKVAVKLYARAEGTTSPKLKVRLYDHEGRTNNGRNLSADIHLGKDFQNYFFELDGSFFQVHPEEAMVDAANIVKMALEVKGQDVKVFVQKAELILSSSVIAKKKAIPVGVNGGKLQVLSPEVWTVDPGLTLTGTESSELVIRGEGVGPNYEAMWVEIPTMSLLEKKKLKLKGRYEGAFAPYVRVDLVDYNGLVTNKQPLFVKFEEGKVGQEQELVFDFDGRFAQSYPNQSEVDAARITRMILYVNAGHYPFSGSVTISEIEAF